MRQIFFDNQWKDDVKFAGHTYNLKITLVHSELNDKAILKMLVEIPEDIILQEVSVSEVTYEHSKDLGGGE